MIYKDCRTGIIREEKDNTGSDVILNDDFNKDDITDVDLLMWLLGFKGRKVSITVEVLK